MRFIEFVRSRIRRWLFAQNRFHRVPTAKWRGGYLPAFECCEDRVLLANYFWFPQPGLQVNAQNMASTAGNWRDANNVPYAVAPGAADTLIFDGASNGWCVINPAASATFAAIQVLAGYQGVITVQQNISIGVPNAPTASIFTDANIKGAGIPRNGLPNSITFNGSMLRVNSADSLFNLLVVNAAGNTMNVNGTTNLVDDSQIVNRGTLNVADGATVSLNRSFLLNLNMWNFLGAATINNVDPPARPTLRNNPFFDNGSAGTITCEGNNTVTDNVAFTNSGTFRVYAGSTFALTTNGAEQTGAAASTQIDGTFTIRTGTGKYTIKGGNLRGNGTINASVATSNALNAAVTIDPGTAGVLGQLTIVGNLLLSSNATVEIGIRAANVIGVLAVQRNANGLGGSIEFNSADLTIDRAANFTPATGTFVFVTAVSVPAANTAEGTLGVLDIPNNNWNAGGQNNLSLKFDRIDGNNGRLFVQVILPNGNVANANANGGAPVLLAKFQNDPAFGGNAIWVAAVNGNAANVGQTITTANGGSFMALSNGTFDYSAPVGFTGIDWVSYEVTDGTTSKWATILLYDPSSAPSVTDTQFVLNHLQTLTISGGSFVQGLLADALNFNTSTEAITAVNGDADDVGVSTPTYEGGTVTVDADGDFTYDPPADYVGEDYFTITVGDGTSTATGTITLDLTGLRAYASTFSAPYNQTFSLPTGGLLLNNNERNSGLLSIVAVDGDADDVGTAITTSAGGTLTVNANGGFSYTGPTTYAATDSFTYTESDGTSTSTVTVTLDLTDALATDAVYTVSHDQTLTATAAAGLLTSASDADGNALTVTAINGDASAIGNAITTAAGGSLTANADGSFTYTPPSGFVGDDYFTYTVSDGISTSTATVDIAVGQTTPTLTVSDAGGTFNGSTFPATATVAGTITGVDDSPASSLQGVTPTLTYYAGTHGWGTPLDGAPTQAGTYTVVAYFAGSTDYTSAWAKETFTISQATPTVAVSDAGGTYDGNPFAATPAVTDDNGNIATSLEGVTPTIAYYDANNNLLDGAPTQAGAYTAVATFSGSTDYGSAQSSPVGFTIGLATPIIAVSDATAVYTGSAFVATATVAGVVSGVDSTPGPTLEGVGLTLVYYIGSDASGNPLSGPPTEPGTFTVVANFQGSTDYSSYSNQITFAITAPATWVVTVGSLSGLGDGFTSSGNQSHTLTYTPLGVNNGPAGYWNGESNGGAYWGVQLTGVSGLSAGQSAWLMVYDQNGSWFVGVFSVYNNTDASGTWAERQATNPWSCISENDLAAPSGGDGIGGTIQVVPGC
jgi:hypothetical protein